MPLRGIRNAFRISIIERGRLRRGVPTSPIGLQALSAVGGFADKIAELLAQQLARSIQSRFHSSFRTLRDH